MLRLLNWQLLTFLLMGLTGCSQMTQSQIRALETREIDAPYDKTYDAALNAMFSMGLSIEHTDKNSGIITGRSGDHIQRASTHWAFRGLVNVKKVTLMISKVNENRTMIRMKVLINEQPQTDEKLMTDIWQRIEKEDLLSEAFTESASTCPTK